MSQGINLSPEMALVKVTAADFIEAMEAYYGVLQQLENIIRDHGALQKSGGAGLIGTLESDTSLFIRQPGSDTWHPVTLASVMIGTQILTNSGQSAIFYPNDPESMNIDIGPNTLGEIAGPDFIPFINTHTYVRPFIRGINGMLFERPALPDSEWIADEFHYYDTRDNPYRRNPDVEVSEYRGYVSEELMSDILKRRFYEMIDEESLSWRSWEDILYEDLHHILHQSQLIVYPIGDLRELILFLEFQSGSLWEYLAGIGVAVLILLAMRYAWADVTLTGIAWAAGIPPSPLDLIPFVSLLRRGRQFFKLWNTLDDANKLKLVRNMSKINAIPYDLVDEIALISVNHEDFLKYIDDLNNSSTMSNLIAKGEDPKKIAAFVELRAGLAEDIISPLDELVSTGRVSNIDDLIRLADNPNAIILMHYPNVSIDDAIEVANLATLPNVSGTGILEGLPEDIDPRSSRTNQRGHRLQNRAAPLLSEAGFFVYQKPKVHNPDLLVDLGYTNLAKDPDYVIGNHVFDHFATTSKSPEQVRTGVLRKVEDAQAYYVVLNLTDAPSELNIRELESLLWRKPPIEDGRPLRELIIVITPDEGASQVLEQWVFVWDGDQLVDIVVISH